MKWSIEADDNGILFHTTYAGGVQHRRPINVDDDVSNEPEIIRAAAKETWTDDVRAAARMEREKQALERDARTAEAAVATEAQQVADDKELTARAIALLRAAGIDLDAIAARGKK